MELMYIIKTSLLGFHLNWDVPEQACFDQIFIFLMVLADLS